MYKRVIGTGCLKGMAILVVTIGSASAEKHSVRSLRLEEVKIQEDAFRPGWDIESKIPSKASSFRIDGKTFFLFDLDENGGLTTDGKDGIALKPFPFVVPLPSVLLLSSGQYDVSFDGQDRLRLSRQNLNLRKRLLKEASDLTELRIREGLFPVFLNDKASEACDKHCEYLRMNGLSNASAGLKAHDEIPGNPGYTPEGARAGTGNISFGVSFQTGLWNWYSTAWHGSKMKDPLLREVGVSDKNGVSMLHFYKYDDREAQKDTFHPPDKAVEVPLRFAGAPEFPKPIPDRDETGFGFPIYIRMTGSLQGKKLKYAEVREDGQEKIGGHFSCPQNPSNPAVPRNMNLAVFLPWKPLKRGTRHTVRFEFEGMEKPLEWEFVTERR